MNHNIVPVRNYDEFDTVFEGLEKADKLTYLFLLNCGGREDIGVRMAKLEAVHLGIKAVLMDANRPYHHKNLSGSENVIMINDEAFKKAEGRCPTAEEVEFLETFEWESGDEAEAPAKSEASDAEAAQKDNGDALYEKDEDQAGAQIGQRRLKKRKADRVERQRKFEEICDFISSESDALLQLRLCCQADNPHRLFALSAAQQRRQQGALALDFVAGKSVSRV